MMKLKTFIIFAVLGEAQLLDNGLARTPPMGWMSWGYYMCEVNCKKNPQKCLDEKLILSVVDEFYTKGYQEAGYNYIIIDDCWSEKKRDIRGRLVPDRQRFPNGMKYIADYIHTRGLKFGLYLSAGETTCMRYPGSKGHLKVDADTFASWDVDYVKFDGCFVKEDYLNTVYKEFGKYLNETRRPMVYSCSWPYYIEFIYKHMPNYTAVSETCNLWRNYHDVFNNWGSVKGILRHYQREHVRMSSYIAPGQWNDPDMLIIGTGVLTEGQSRIQMSVYAMLSAPLIFSCDMSKISPSDRSILLNMNLIAVAQDPLGIQAIPYDLKKSQVILWVKKHLPMKGDWYHSSSFLFLNFGNNKKQVTVKPKDYGLNCTDGYTILDVFSDIYIQNTTLNETLTVTVPYEGICCVLYFLPFIVWVTISCVINWISAPPSVSLFNVLIALHGHKKNNSNLPYHVYYMY